MKVYTNDDEGEFKPIIRLTFVRHIVNFKNYDGNGMCFLIEQATHCHSLAPSIASRQGEIGQAKPVYYNEWIMFDEKLDM